MNLVLLFEGTGQGVEGKFTNVTRLRDLLVEDEAQRLHLESGPGTHFGAYLFGKVRTGRGEEQVFPGVHSDIGGLYEDNHEMADVTLSWVAEPAVARGLRLKEDVSLRCDLDPETLPVHDSFRLVSNLWGLLGSSVRSFVQLKHP